MLHYLLAHLFHLIAFLPLFGLLEGEPDAGASDAPADQGSTLDRATQYMKEHPLGEEPEKPAEPPPDKPAEPEKPVELVKPAEAVKPAEPVTPAEAPGYDPTKALEKPSDFEKLPFFKDATFQKLLGEHKDLALQVNGLADVFRGEWREGSKYAIGTTDELKAVLEDAFSIYDIGNMNMPVESFWAVFEKNYPEANVRAVLASLAALAESKGVKASEAGSLNDPNAVRLTRLENERKAEAQERVRTTAENQTKEATAKLDAHFTEFFKGVNVDAADELDYLTVMRAEIKENQKLAQEVREGKYGNLDRMMTEYHNRMVDRQKRWMEARIKKADEREKGLPKGVKPNQGASPVGAEAPAKPKVNLTDGEARRAEARRIYKESA